MSTAQTPSPVATCPECGVPVGPGSGRSAAKHAIYCLHLTPGEIQAGKSLFRRLADQGDRRAQRVLALLALENE